MRTAGIGLCAVLSLVAQAGDDLSIQASRHKASQLFAQGKRLEALPLLEDLVKTNPRDSVLLVALAAGKSACAPANSWTGHGTWATTARWP